MSKVKIYGAVTPLVKAAVDQGWTIVHRSGDGVTLKAPNGNSVRLSTSPRRDPRSFKNDRSLLRRNGVEGLK